MAWEYVTISPLLNNSTCNDTHLTAAGKFASGTLPSDFTREPIYKIDWETAFPVNTFMTGNENFGLKYSGTNIEFWKNNSIQGLISMRWDWYDSQNHNNIIFIAAIDRDREVGTFLVYKRYYGLEDNAWNAPPYTDTYLQNQDNSLIETNDCYNALLALIPVLYQWSSVPAISGKNKTVSLTTLKEESINDGSPVDDASASAFNNAPDSCSVGGIVSVDLPIVDDNPLTIAVKYNIPELTDSVYSSCKVVAKKNKIPKSKTDGDKILDVSPSSHGCVIRGLEQETKYYVVVFVEDSVDNKAESEPGGPVRTGKQDGIFKMRITTMQGIKDNDFKEVIEVTRV